MNKAMSKVWRVTWGTRMGTADIMIIAATLDLATEAFREARKERNEEPREVLKVEYLGACYV